VTPAQHLIRSRNKEIVGNWNRPRFRRLAMILEMTEGELSEMVFMAPVILRKALKENKFPPPIAGHLENIERWVRASRLGVRFKKPTAQDEVLMGKLKELAQ